jgi:branched-chain amino acid transport system ATP-binding protein
MPEPALVVRALDAWRGTAHVLQSLDLGFDTGRLAVIGRNGMGKTTLCEALTGVLGLEAGNRVVGSVLLYGEEVVGSSPHKISRRGVGYVPQGRRVFRSLTVEENLRVALRKGGAWDVPAVYDLFPRLAQRRTIGAANLSGGEQQMLAVGRALVTQPRLLIMDEPSEGLAPVIVDQLVAACRSLSDTGMDLIVVEQNLGVALELADRVVVVSNGRIVAQLASAQLAADAELQQRYLGIGVEAGV